MFSTDLMESRQERVAINGVEPQMIGMLVSYAYTAEVVISKANVQALLAAANLLDVMAVREACCRFMERQMDEINCVGIHCFAEAHSCKELERRSMEYIQQHFSSVCKQVSLVSSSVRFFLPATKTMHSSQYMCGFNKGSGFKNTSLIAVCIETAVHSAGCCGL